MLSFQRGGFIIFIGAIILCCFSCKKTPTPAVSFYYWKTKFDLNETEKNTLSASNVKQLYVRYFDVGYDKQQQKAAPIGTIQFNKENKHAYRIIPVIYIKNEVFLKGNHVAIDSLSNDVLHLVTQINKVVSQSPAEIQFDCDWSEATKDNYFQFLKTYKKISGQSISATIRLHQVKHTLVTGIPPVDHGVLMFYNMGKIDASEHSSIYDASVAASYLDQLNAYPIKLDIALPIFSWGIQIRKGQVVHLLNKMNAQHFNKDTCFQLLKNNRFRVVESCFKGGYYFIKNDEVKVEQITPGDLKSMASQITKKTKQSVQQIIFYDLDSFNLNNYETKIYAQTARLFN